MKTLITSINRSPLPCGFFTLTIALCCFALSPVAKAQLPAPSPDGGYPGGNTAEGINALHDVNTAVGINNTAVGTNALAHDTTGNYNTAVGEAALANNTSGNFNMAIGTEALRDNNSNFNLAIGFRVLFMNTTGNHLTGIGAAALRNNTIANDNTAIGADALRENTIGEDNTAIGAAALTGSTSSEFNVAVGDSALTSFNGTTAADGANTALGSIALVAETSGEENVAVGRRALESLLSGSNNTAVGWRAGDDYIGAESGNISIGSDVTGVAGENNTTRIGNIYSTIQPAVGVDPDFVTINSTGRLGRANISSRRYKHDIKPMDKTSEQLYGLKPVTFRYLKEYDATQTIAFGLIAEDVAQVYPDLVGRNKKGQPESVRYEQINAMMLNEFIKEHKKVEEQQASMADLKSTVALQQKEMHVLTAQLKEQAAQIQKVSAQLESTKPAPEVVANK